MTGAPRRDLEAELLQWDGTFPPAWKPAVGESLVGTVLRYSVGQTQYGSVRTVLLETDSGERVSLWLSSRVLLSLFEQERPKVGERVGLRYLGKHPERGYRRYTMLVDRPETDLDFAPLGGEEAAQAPEPSPATGRTPYCDAVLAAPGTAPLPARPAPPEDPDDPFSGF